MSTSLPALPPIATPSSCAVEQAAAVAAPAVDASSTAPLDFQWITSRTDYGERADRFLQASRQLGMRTEVIYLEDLEGSAAGDKLDALRKATADAQSCGKITDTTLRIVRFHGAAATLPFDASLERFCRESLGRTADSRTDAATADDVPQGPVHVMSAAGGTLAFPTDLLDAALRSRVAGDGQQATAGGKTIIYASCHVGQFRNSARETGGDYVFTVGKKPGLSDDSDASLMGILHEASERRRRGDVPLTGRDCWMVMRNISGEHVAYVGDERVEIHKVLQSGHREPVLGPRTPAISDQAIRILLAKLEHGSAASVQQVIERWGPAILDAELSRVVERAYLWPSVLTAGREAEQKACAVVTHADGLFSEEGRLLACLNDSLALQWTSVIPRLFEQLARRSPLALPLASFVHWLKRDEHRAYLFEKTCRRHRQLSEAVGDYLVRAIDDAERRGPGTSVALPAFLASLAGRQRRKANSSTSA